MLHLHSDSSHAWLDHGGHEAERARDQERGLDPSPHAGALLLGAPRDPAPTANCHLYAGWGRRPQTGQGRAPLGPGRHWLVDHSNLITAGPDKWLTCPGSDLSRVRSRGWSWAEPLYLPILSWETSVPAARCPSSLLQKLQVFCGRRPALHEGSSSETPATCLNPEPSTFLVYTEPPLQGHLSSGPGSSGPDLEGPCSSPSPPNLSFQRASPLPTVKWAPLLSLGKLTCCGSQRIRLQRADPVG